MSEARACGVDDDSTKTQHPQPCSLYISDDPVQASVKALQFKIWQLHDRQ